MVIEHVRLKNFRNHAESTLSFAGGINVLLGENGQGKTNVLEAISYLSLTKSFYASSDATAVRFGTEAFEVDGVMVSDSGLEFRVHAAYVRATGEKAFLINNAPPESMASVIGIFPVVILSPENNAITFGGPAARRRFVDLTLSQISSVYLDDLMEYRKILRHRNRLLFEGRSGADVGQLLEPWTATLVQYGSRVIQRRQQFVAEFRTYIERAYNDLVAGGEVPGITYVSCGQLPGGASADDIAAIMARELEERKEEELRRGTTLVGPHRDELRFTINGAGLQQYASQGQHKTFLVALKVAEFFYVRERRNESPIFLLDDLFSELDEGRSRRILDMVGNLGQTVITTTDERVLQETTAHGDNNRRIIIENGSSRPDRVAEQKSA